MELDNMPSVIPYSPFCMRMNMQRNPCLLWNMTIAFETLINAIHAPWNTVQWLKSLQTCADHTDNWQNSIIFHLILFHVMAYKYNEKHWAMAVHCSSSVAANHIICNKRIMIYVLQKLVYFFVLFKGTFGCKSERLSFEIFSHKNFSFSTRYFHIKVHKSYFFVDSSDSIYFLALLAFTSCKLPLHFMPCSRF